MIDAYVLIQTDPGKTGRIVEALMEVKGVISAEGVTGPYDIVAVAEAANLDELSRRVIRSVQAIDGVIRTLPCTVVSPVANSLEGAVPAGADIRGWEKRLCGASEAE